MRAAPVSWIKDGLMRMNFLIIFKYQHFQLC